MASEYGVGLRELDDMTQGGHGIPVPDGTRTELQKNCVVNPQATGVAMLRLGLDGEYFPVHWLSIGVRGGYDIGFQKFSLNNASIKSDLQSNDNVGTILLPIRPGSDGKIQYLLPDGSGYKNLRVSMDGWEVMLGVTFYH